MFSGTEHDAARILFIGTNAGYAGLRDGLNTVQDTLRGQQILSNLQVAPTGGTPSENIVKYTGASVTYGASAGSTATATIWEDSGATARLFAFDNLFVAGGKPRTGTLTGVFNYRGAFATAASSALNTLREGTFTLAANFGTNRFSFTGTTTNGSGDQTSRLVVATADGVATAATGVLTTAAGSYNEGAGTTGGIAAGLTRAFTAPAATPLPDCSQQPLAARNMSAALWAR